jgi:transposase
VKSVKFSQKINSMNPEFLIASKILNLPPEWQIENIVYSESNNQVDIFIRYNSDKGVCKETGELCPIYDFRPARTWRHLDYMGCTCFIHCRVPRIKNSDGKVISVPTPWSDEDERHTRAFENYAIKVLQGTHNQTKTGEILHVSYEKINRIMKNAVRRGLERRNLSKDEIIHISIDEKSYKKGHQYATIISDIKGGRIIEVGEGRTSKSTEELLEKTFSKEQLENMKAVCVDMWEPYMQAIKKNARKPR